ncbi:hypothetical protein ABW636_12945 [Aquimarina sp. 2201CG1-2-11]|uniref:hypothetical protein n=1 Tax=Aquimarina discodermiae TaxID=3231043 RepID=UPI003462674C
MKSKLIILLAILLCSCGAQKENKKKLTKVRFVSYRLFNEIHNYYYFNDTIKIETPLEKTIYIPNTYKKFTARKFRNKVYRNELDWGNLYKRWTTRYKVEKHPNDTKTILGIKGYKLIIHENSKRTFDTFDEVYELYVSDKFNIPFNHYDFLKVKNTLNYSGLILECKTYFKETPLLNITYTLEKFNTEKQDEKLKKIDFSKYEYHRL